MTGGCFGTSETRGGATRSNGKAQGEEGATPPLFAVRLGTAPAATTYLLLLWVLLLLRPPASGQRYNAKAMDTFVNCLVDWSTQGFPFCLGFVGGGGG